MPDRTDPVLIAGGGIGGLAAAIALARRGIGARVLERRCDLAEAGAGIQIGPNGVHVLRALGVAEALAGLAGRPEGIRVRQGANGRVLTRPPLGDWLEARHGAPYWTLHRHDLHAALAARAEADRLIEITRGFKIAGIGDDDAGVSVQDREGNSVRGIALVGADGVGSSVRQHLLGPIDLGFSGKTATRTVLPASAIAVELAAGDVGVWLSPGAHVVHYPVRGGAEVAVVAIIDEAFTEPGWHAPADPALLLDRLAGFAPELRQALAAATGWHKWALVDARPFALWSKGRIALLGDAAHPVLPFLAQGGVLALEDAIVLADELAADRSSPAAALAAYAVRRQPRAARVQAASRTNGRAYHLHGPARVARDAALRLIPGARLMAGFDWLYGWRA